MKTGKGIDNMLSELVEKKIISSGYPKEHFTLTNLNFVSNLHDSIQDLLFTYERWFLFAKKHLNRIDLKVWANFYLTHPSICATWAQRDVNLILSLDPLQDIDDLKNLEFWTNYISVDSLCAVLELQNEHLDIYDGDLLVTHTETGLMLKRKTILFNSLKPNINYNTKQVEAFLIKWESIFASVDKSSKYKVFGSEESFEILSKL